MKQEAVVASYELTKEYRRKWNALEGEDIDWLLKNWKVMQFATDRTGLSSERGK